MANKALFSTTRGHAVPAADAVNHAGGPAYRLSAEAALVQLAATGTFNGTFYADGAEQVDVMLDLCSKVDPEYVARVAVYAREHGRMKDTPAFLLAKLSSVNPGLFASAFPRVIDTGKMLRNFAQIVRSGATGRKSLGYRPKKAVQEWFAGRDADAIFKASVGNDPSLADVIRMVHPKPETAAKRALYGYLLGKEHQARYLPVSVKALLKFREDPDAPVPDVPHELLTSVELTDRHWVKIAQNARWQATRMNLNTFARHNVFGTSGMTKTIADRLRNREEIAKAKAFPYQLLAAYLNVSGDVPNACREALQDAMEIAIKNTPEIPGKTFLCPDVSGSMSDPVTGHRKGATSKVRCVDVAGLVCAAVLRKNPDAEVLPFEVNVVNLRLNPRDSVMSNAAKLAAVGGGGTNCSAPLADLNRRGARGDLVLYVSENESWADGNRYGRGTGMMNEWSAFKARNPKAKLVCVDLTPTDTVQANSRSDVLNVGGFSDAVFGVIASFVEGGNPADRWVDEVKRIDLAAKPEKKERKGR